jgi:hypothetical protein
VMNNTDAVLQVIWGVLREITEQKP